MKNLLNLLAIVFLLALAPVARCQIEYGANKKAGNYAEINGIQIYYEIYGAGEALLLLHGNGGSIATFADQIPELSKHFKVIAVDSRAQGRSTDSDQEITYALMASDMSALIEKLNLGSVYVVGWSDGGNIGLELAVAQPQKVKKLVTMGANYSHVDFEAAPDNVVMDPNDPRSAKTAALLKQYKEGREKLSPAIAKKLSELTQKYPNLTVDQLKQIKAAVLVMIGDHDAITIEQTISLFRSLPHSQLLIVPGATHLAPIEQPDFANAQIIKFLTTPYGDLDRYYWLKFFN